MTTRRRFFAHMGAAAAAARLLPEAAYAQRAAVKAVGRGGNMVWLNANENPAGPPAASLDAMRDVLPSSGRYHYNEVPAIYAAVAKSEGLRAEEVVLGSGSSEVLHTAVDLFTSPSSLP